MGLLVLAGMLLVSGASVWVGVVIGLRIVRNVIDRDDREISKREPSEPEQVKSYEEWEEAMAEARENEPRDGDES